MKLAPSNIPDTRDAPPFLDHSDDQAAHSPRKVMAHFVKALSKAICGVEMTDLPSSLAQKGRSFGVLRQAVDQLYEEIEQTRPTKKTRIGLRLLGESALGLVHLLYYTPQETHQASQETLTKLQRRPFPHLTLDQLYCTPDSSERRVRQVDQMLPPGGSVLFLGDDDLCSLVMAQRRHDNIHMLDFDPRLLTHIQSQAPEVVCHQVDLVHSGIPQSMHHAFDAVVLDPPWDLSGCWDFLDKAWLCLKASPHARIFLSFCPIYIEHLQGKAHLFWQRMASRRLVCEQLHPYFHLYSLKGTPFLELLLQHIPTKDNPLLACLRELPYGFSHLYTLRPIQGAALHPLRRRWLHWWHAA